MKVLTSAEMREVDRLTEEIGIPGPILMENAGHRVVEYLVERFSPLSQHEIVVICGKGNNGGDGYVIARQLFTRFRVSRLFVVAVDAQDTSRPRRMLEACGCTISTDLTSEMRNATLVVDAILGTGVKGEAHGRALELIREINSGFARAFVVAVDVPSGMNSDTGTSPGDIARAGATITFTAPKICHVLPPNCDRVGELRIARIGSPDRLMENVQLHLSNPGDFRHLLQSRPLDSNKGMYGHVLVVGGECGKSGAAEMAGTAALRSGAGLVTVASSADRYAAPELMTAFLPGSWQALQQIADRKTVLAIGPGLGTSADHVALVRDAIVQSPLPMVVDADGLNAIAGWKWQGDTARVLTPHPGEMARLAGCSTADVQADRIGIARGFARAHNCTLVLKGHRSVIAFPDGRCWINPTGTPALATGGSGDVLTGMIAGLMAQSPDEFEAAVIAGVFLHGLAAQKAGLKWGERSLIATDLLAFLPEAMRECQRIPDAL